jgi:Flp pilus assembly protein TadB
MWRPSLATAVAARPTRRKLVVALAVAVAVVALLAAGIPLTTSVLFAGLAACLGMHLFMGHGNGDHHAAEHSPESTVDR